MLTPNKPKELSTAEIMKKHKKIDENYLAFSNEMVASLKKFKLRQRAVLKYTVEEIYPYVSIDPYDPETGDTKIEVPEESYKAFSEELKAACRKYSLKQYAALETSSGAMRAVLKISPYEWPDEAQVDTGTKESNTPNDKQTTQGADTKEAGKVKKGSGKKVPKK